MEPVPGTSAFRMSGEVYDAFMGRYSKSLAVSFIDSIGVVAGQRALDVGCGPGALTSVLVDRLGADAVAAFDPSPTFVAACADAHPGVDVREGMVEAIPFDDASFDVALAELVLHFVSDPAAAGAELLRVVRPSGLIGACVWDFAEGMEMLRAFWDAALAVDPAAPDEARTLRFGRVGEIAGWLEDLGLETVLETELTVASTYAGFDELWAGFQSGVGPAGAYCAALEPDQQALLRDALFERLGAPSGALTLSATARSAHGHVPRTG